MSSSSSCLRRIASSLLPAVPALAPGVLAALDFGWLFLLLSFAVAALLDLAPFTDELLIDAVVEAEGSFEPCDFDCASMATRGTPLAGRAEALLRDVVEVGARCVCDREEEEEEEEG